MTPSVLIMMRSHGPPYADGRGEFCDVIIGDGASDCIVRSGKDWASGGAINDGILIGVSSSLELRLEVSGDVFFKEGFPLRPVVRELLDHRCGHDAQRRPCKEAQGQDYRAVYAAGTRGDRGRKAQKAGAFRALAV